MSTTKVPKRVASSIINALKGGVVPRVGLGYIAVGRSAEINALLHDISIVEDGGAFFRFIMGKFGSGKSFLLQTMRQHAMDRGFATCDADLSPERRLTGTKGQGLATYRELMKSLSVKACPDSGALNMILEKWIDSIRCEIESEGMHRTNNFFEVAVEQRMLAKIYHTKNMVHGYDFSKVINAYYFGYRDGDEERQSNALRWLRGEYSSKVQAKQDLDVNVIIDDDNWYDYLKLMAAFLHSAGYKGLIVMIDELVNIMKITHTTTRQNNYEKILMMYNDALQGKAEYIGILMGSTPQCIEDTRRGLFSYEALRSRLEQGRFGSDEMEDMLAPIIRLRPLTYEELVVLTERLTDIHGQLFGYEPKISQTDRFYFIKMEFERVGFESHATPREIIRDYIEMLNILYQHPEMTVAQAICGGDFEFAKSDANDEDNCDEMNKSETVFEDFIL